MKIILNSLWLLALALPAFAQSSNEKTESSHRVGRSSEQSKASSTSVTTTSDGKTTVKKTVTVVDGVRKVVIETTDENGNTTRTESGGTSEPQETGPWIGLRGSEVPQILRDQLGLPEDEGLAVELVAENSPASESGLQKGDLLLRIGDDPVSSKDALAKSLRKRQVGDEVKATVMRKAKRMEVTMTLAEAPKEKERVVPEDLREELAESSVESVEVDVTGEGFDALLNNPDLPEDFKKTIREMQESLREFEKKER